MIVNNTGRIPLLYGPAAWLQNQHGKSTRYRYCTSSIKTLQFFMISCLIFSPMLCFGSFVAKVVQRNDVGQSLDLGNPRTSVFKDGDDSHANHQLDPNRFSGRLGYQVRHHSRDLLEVSSAAVPGRAAIQQPAAAAHDLQDQRKTGDLLDSGSDMGNENRSSNGNGNGNSNRNFHRNGKNDSEVLGRLASLAKRNSAGNGAQTSNIQSPIQDGPAPVVQHQSTAERLIDVESDLEDKPMTEDKTNAILERILLFRQMEQNGYMNPALYPPPPSLPPPTLPSPPSPPPPSPPPPSPAPPSPPPPSPQPPSPPPPSPPSPSPAPPSPPSPSPPSPSPP
ncbi:hypothetical protein Vretimale_6374, partial [Volvox reticuliferus]